jgi:hypothetical protein
MKLVFTLGQMEAMDFLRILNVSIYSLGCGEFLRSSCGRKLLFDLFM